MEKYRSKHSSHYMQEYFKLAPACGNLIDEISFVLEKRLGDAGVEIAHTAKRVKSAESFLEKIERKNYRNPIKETTDLAGVRVVFLYLDDFNKIEEIIKKSFIVVEKIDKVKEDIDRFGYLASHYIVKVRKPVVGERYSLLKGLKCEIQIRTVVQDSWAILSHHLMYKNEKDIPQILKRRVHQLAAVLENADQQFNDIEEKRRNYLSRLSDPNIKLEELMKEESNKDSILVYLKRKFPELPVSSFDGHAETVMVRFDVEAYPKLKEIDKILEKTQLARSNYSNEEDEVSALSHLALALGCVDRRYRELTKFGDSAILVFEEFDKE
tara:strand:+ start:83 stop:1057 length:975 start_codon:yes stop_codon:yes gene_type:complete